MKKAMLALVFGSAIFLAACGGGGDTATKDATPADTKTETPAPAETTTADAGEEVYKKSCLMCHGADLAGAGGAPALTGVGSRLTEEEIKNIAMNGRNTMPGVLAGKDADAAAVAKWLAANK